MLFHNISRTGTTATYKHLVVCMCAHMRLNTCVCHERTEERTAAWPFWWKWIRDIFLGWLWCVRNQHYSSFNHTSIWSGPCSECEMCLGVSHSVQQLCNRLTPLRSSLSFSIYLSPFVLLLGGLNRVTWAVVSEHTTQDVQVLNTSHCYIALWI